MSQQHMPAITRTYAIFGPLLGWVFLLLCWPWLLITRGADAIYLKDLLEIAPVLLGASYIIGLPQAVACGLYLRRSLKHQRPFSRTVYYALAAFFNWFLIATLIHNALYMRSWNEDSPDLALVPNFNYTEDILIAFLPSMAGLFSAALLFYYFKRRLAGTPYALPTPHTPSMRPL